MKKTTILVVAIFTIVCGLVLYLLLHKTKLIKQPYINTRPNIIIIMTDQERYPMHWPNGWVEKHLPSQARLKKHGLVFNQAYTAASECCPSRAVMMTGKYYPVNGVSTTDPLVNLPTDIPTIGTVLSSQGYDVVWKGKWHLSNPVLEKNNDNNWSEMDIPALQKAYGMAQWNPPDAANILDAPFLFSLGGGRANNDGRYVQGITQKGQTPGYGDSLIQYLEKKAKDNNKPFCLFVSFGNPHDVWVYPTYWQEAGYKQQDFAGMGIELPPNYADDLSTKPSIQTTYRNLFDMVFPLPYQLSKVEYANFYAYLHTVVDKHIVKTLDTLDRLGLTEKSIIIRTADHGEAGLSHGLRQKAYSVYEEMIHVPLIISNPVLFPQTKQTDSLYSHADLLPTLTDIAGVKNVYSKGRSIFPVVKNNTVQVQDSILFAYDDVIPGLTESSPASHIRAVRSGDYIYAVYFTPNVVHYEYEMYNLVKDPQQMVNLLYAKNITPDSVKVAATLDDVLRAKIEEYDAMPKGTIWPLNIWKL